MLKDIHILHLLFFFDYSRVWLISVAVLENWHQFSILRLSKETVLSAFQSAIFLVYNGDMKHETSLQIQSMPDVIEETKTALEPFYRVIIHNDDITPMDFVVTVLMSIFILSQPKALEVMLVAHYKGAAYVQTLPKTEAEKRINKAHFAAGLDGYPLHFSIEPE
jgi:ATP-dependent Clp protease adaptor protein ClpS